MKPAFAGLPRVAAGLLDQALIACANAGTTIVALALLSRDRAGGLVLSLGLGYLVLTLNRAFVGDVLVTMASRLEPGPRARLVRDGLATAALIGAFSALILLGVWVLRPRTGDIDLQDLVWLAPFLPAVLVHDTGRSSYLADSAQSSALVIDLVWVGTQAALVAALTLAGVRGGGVILGCWGAGGLAGSTVFLARTRAWPWQGEPRRFAGETRHLSGWFTATQVIGQFQVQAVAFLVGLRFSASQLSGLRGGQTALIQPVQNFNMAVQALIVPRLSRLAGDAARLTGQTRRDAAAALRRQTGLLAVAFAGFAALLVAIMVPLAHLVLAHLSKFADIAPLALPLSVQAGIYLVELPFAAALRGMHRARLLFVRYLIYTASSLAGLVLGADVDGLRGAVWGLTVGAAVSLATMITFYAVAATRLAAADGLAGPESVAGADSLVGVEVLAGSVGTAPMPGIPAQRGPVEPGPARPPDVRSELGAAPAHPGTAAL
jgi:Polysaccharide biosynthesis protein